MINKLILTVIFILCCLIIPSANAITTHDLTVNPEGPYISGSKVVVIIPINFQDNGLATFDENNKIQFITELENAEWFYYLNINGKRHTGPKSYGKLFKLINWDITYPKMGFTENLTVILEGTVPNVTRTKNINLVDIQELDSSNKPVSQFQRYGLVGQKTDIINGINNLNAERYKLKTEITNLSSSGQNLNYAQGSYDDAGTKIDLAKRLLDDLTSTQYKIAMEDLFSADIEIQDGFIEIQKVKIDIEIQKANQYKKSIETCMSNITDLQEKYDTEEYFKITEDKELEKVSLNVVSEMKDRKQYDQSYALAIKTREDLNSTLQKACVFEKETKARILPFQKYFIPMSIIVITIICGAVGIFIYRKKKKQVKKEDGNK